MDLALTGGVSISTQTGTASSEALLALIEKSLDDDQAFDVITIDLRGKSSLADYMVIGSGRSQRHVASTAGHLSDQLKEAGLGRAALRLSPGGDWVLLDAGDVIVHLFRPEVREFYNLEKMWTAALIDEAETGS